MADADGDGWTRCGRGHRHWGRRGAAGLLAAAADGRDGHAVLLIRRARWGHHGGTWGPPGGARDSHESAAGAALREATEECGAMPATLRIHGLLTDDHGGWSFQTVVAAVAEPFPVSAASHEVVQAAWVPVGEVGSLPLHPGFAAAWPVLRDSLEPVTLIVDGANVMGSRAGGWWRDPAGAMVRLHGELAKLAATGVARLPDDAGAAALDRWFPDVVLVVEGRARAALDRVTPDRVTPDRVTADGATADGATPAPAAAGSLQCRAAAGSGDDLIADLAARLPGRRIVVTADQGLRQRCRAGHAFVTGPRWLTALL